MNREDLNGAVRGRIYANVNIEDVGMFRLRSLTTREHVQLREWLNAEDDETSRKRWNRVDIALVAWCLVDKENRPMFRPSEAESGEFDEWRGSVVKSLAEAAESVTGFLSKGFNLEDIEGAVGN